jgi:hypothetical protein
MPNPGIVRGVIGPLIATLLPATPELKKSSSESTMAPAPSPKRRFLSTTADAGLARSHSCRISLCKMAPRRQDWAAGRAGGRVWGPVKLNYKIDIGANTLELGTDLGGTGQQVLTFVIHEGPAEAAPGKKACPMRPKTLSVTAAGAANLCRANSSSSWYIRQNTRSSSTEHEARWKNERNSCHQYGAHCRHFRLQQTALGLIAAWRQT